MKKEKKKTPLFLDDTIWVKFFEAMESWKGTPYRHFTMVKNRGVDCTAFIGALFFEIGVLNSIERIYYPKDWPVHSKEEFVRDGISYHMEHNTKPGFSFIVFKKEEIEDINSIELIRGDILTFALASEVSHHAGINIGEGRMFHVMAPKGVSKLRYGQWKDKLTTIYRIMIEV